MMIVGSWLHPYKILGGMSQYLASHHWGRDLLNQRLYRDKFKLMTPVTEGSTREADIARAISTLAETPEGQKHLEVLPTTDDDSSDEDCPLLEDPKACHYEPDLDKIIGEMFGAEQLPAQGNPSQEPPELPH
jgi:hypothetical protein